MKASFSFSILASLLLMLGSCNGSPTYIRATGVFFEVVVVTNPTTWNNSVGDLIKEELTMPVPGLLWDEPSMRVSYVPSSEFKGMMTYVRNILIVNIDESLYTKVSVKTERNHWAVGQVVIHVSSPTESLLVDYLKENKGLIVDYFNKVEMERMVDLLNTTYSMKILDSLKSSLNVMMHVPPEINAFTSSTDFFWTTNDANTGRMDIVVYTFPYTDPQTFTHEYMLTMRNSILGDKIKGAVPGSYMSTNSPLTSYTPITLYGKYCGVLRGLWEMEGDMMGGPFVSFARLDEENNRVVVAEGFVYAPEIDNKKNLVKRLEATLHTLRLPGEFDAVLDVPEINE